MRIFREGANTMAAAAKHAEEITTSETNTEPAIPTVGRVVHFHREEETPLAAIVTAVGKHEDHPHVATLTVFALHGPRVIPDVPFSADPAVGHWSWTPNNR